MEIAILIIVGIAEAAVLAGEAIKIRIRNKQKEEETEIKALETRPRRDRDIDVRPLAETAPRERTFLRAFKSVGNGFKSMFTREKATDKDEVKTRARRIG